MKILYNEITYHRYVKQVSRFGIPKADAKDIVETAILAGHGNNIEMYIQYAITLKYGFKPSDELITV